MLSFFSEAPEFRKDPLAGFMKHALRFGDIVRYRGLWTTHQLSHPDHIQQVLQDERVQLPQRPRLSHPEAFPG